MSITSVAEDVPERTSLKSVQIGEPTTERQDSGFRHMKSHFEGEHDDVDKQGVEERTTHELEVLAHWASKHHLTGKKNFLHVHDEWKPAWRKRLIVMVQSLQFDMVCSAAIITNAGLMG